MHFTLDGDAHREGLIRVSRAVQVSNALVTSKDGERDFRLAANGIGRHQPVNLEHTVLALDGSLATTADRLLGLARNVAQFSIGVGKSGIASRDGSASDAVLKDKLERDVVTKLQFLGSHGLGELLDVSVRVDSQAEQLAFLDVVVLAARHLGGGTFVWLEGKGEHWLSDKLKGGLDFELEEVAAREKERSEETNVRKKEKHKPVRLLSTAAALHGLEDITSSSGQVQQELAVAHNFHILNGGGQGGEFTIAVDDLRGEDESDSVANLERWLLLSTDTRELNVGCLKSVGVVVAGNALRVHTLNTLSREAEDEVQVAARNVGHWEGEVEWLDATAGD